jgi:hypothetical protein
MEPRHARRRWVLLTSSRKEGCGRVALRVVVETMPGNGVVRYVLPGRPEMRARAREATCLIFGLPTKGVEPTEPGTWQTKRPVRPDLKGPTERKGIVGCEVEEDASLEEDVKSVHVGHAEPLVDMRHITISQLALVMKK